MDEDSETYCGPGAKGCRHVVLDIRDRSTRSGVRRHLLARSWVRVRESHDAVMDLRVTDEPGGTSDILLADLARDSQAAVQAVAEGRTRAVVPADAFEDAVDLATQPEVPFAYIHLDVLERAVVLHGLPDETVAVLGAVARGCTYAEIATQLRVSTTTVSRRLKEARDALGARTTAELAQRASELGLGRT